jgi:hypothetical protein
MAQELLKGHFLRRDGDELVRLAYDHRFGADAVLRVTDTFGCRDEKRKRAVEFVKRLGERIVHRLTVGHFICQVDGDQFGVVLRAETIAALLQQAF